MGVSVRKVVELILSADLLSFARAIAEVGAVAMVGGAIAWKTDVMTTAIMMYTNRGSFTLGIALGLITHSISQARRIADRVIVLHQGELVEQGDSDVVLGEPRQEQTKRFLDFYGR